MDKPGVPCHVNWCVFTVFSKVEDFSGIPTGDPLHSRALAHSRAPLFTQPCPHCSHSRAPGEQWARLCVFTLQGCVQAARLCRGSPVIPVISSLYILWAGRISRCVRRTWGVPSTHRRRATEVKTPTPPYGHVAGGTANARWSYREGTAPVRWKCLRLGIFCVRFGASEARRSQGTCVAGTVTAESLSDPNQPQETQNLRRNSAAAPDTQEP